MPFSVKLQKNGKYKLYNLEKKRYTKKSFNTKQSAINMKKVYMKYDKK